ncbi:MAG: hypothetical protein QW051_00575 [Candidatus Aenigmatarchaeota archaeon]
MEIIIFLIFLALSVFFLIYGLFSRAIAFIFVSLAFQSLLIWNLYITPEIVRVDTFSYYDSETSSLQIQQHEVVLTDDVTINMLRLVLWSLFIITVSIPLIVK